MHWEHDPGINQTRVFGFQAFLPSRIKMSKPEDTPIFSIASSYPCLRLIPFDGDMTKGYAVQMHEQIWWYLPHQWPIISRIPEAGAALTPDLRCGLSPTYSGPLADDCFCKRCHCQGFSVAMGELFEDDVHAKYCK